jgi:hypothetical protein
MLKANLDASVFGDTHCALGFRSGNYRSDRIVSHSGGWQG